MGYTVDPTTGKKKRQELSGVANSKREAQKALRDRLTDRDRGLLASADSITVADFAERWLSRQTQARARSVALYRQELGYALALIGSMKVKDVRARHLKDALTVLSKQEMTKDKGVGLGKGQSMSGRTLAKVATRLRTVFREAVQDQIIYANPMDGVKTPKTQATERTGRVLDFEQIARLHEVGAALHAARLARLWPALFTAVSVGMRRGEVMGLTWDNVDLERGVLKVRQQMVIVEREAKGGGKKSEVLLADLKTTYSRRDIPMPASLTAALKAHRELQAWEHEVMGETWRDTGAVFATEEGEFTHLDNLNRALAVLLEWSDPETFEERAKYVRKIVEPDKLAHLEAVVRSGKKLPMISPHDLRHTYATLALRRKVPVKVVSKILGHARVPITLDVYRHVLDNEKREQTVDLFAEPLTIRASSQGLTN
ncbi:tyrosine-type recombinase/integrase [Deinococcus peraridilitoris]|nr:site-specific integrase [Deinococcus peraridilitoris]